MPRELGLAREALASARLALNVREYERARRLAEQALEDARVAEARADTESMRQTARDVRLSSEAVHDEATRLTVLY
jgi:Tfp pilus assembly protein PilX